MVGLVPPRNAPAMALQPIPVHTTPSSTYTSFRLLVSPKGSSNKGVVGPLFCYFIFPLFCFVLFCFVLFFCFQRSTVRVFDFGDKRIRLFGKGAKQNIRENKIGVGGSIVFLLSSLFFSLHFYFHFLWFWFLARLHSSKFS
ncbi:hypothetical protein I7I50_09479 [Histoplasma capsulatum G186AR]|uniref:Transmembrane protein n=1 Tax=Ajellomyces capsulatus TaxID=5037 RepID=A0A8H7YVG8_AJECA|nr:hypothetical protein I7I52_07000 [Histoplasma capsulatum]QSS74352.1 hypothetical protein I7I50_09479 [Histoplasma capsulatum G186AR]